MRTSRALLRGDHLEWLEEAPEPPTDVPLHVHVTVWEPESPSEAHARGYAMAALLEQLAERRTFSPDPRPWQVATRTPPRSCLAGARGVMLVESNILIYAAQPADAHLRQFIATHAPAVSAVSYVEVLGYHQLDDEERQYLAACFRLARGLPLSPTVLDQAVALRQQRKMSLGDCPRSRDSAGLRTDARDPQCGGVSMDSGTVTVESC